LFATVIGGIASANLTPASGRQDHTTSPSAANTFVSVPPRPLHPAAYVRDDRETPLCLGRDDSLYSCFYQTGKRKIFARGTGHENCRTARRANHERTRQPKRSALAVKSETWGALTARRNPRIPEKDCGHRLRKPAPRASVSPSTTDMSRTGGHVDHGSGFFAFEKTGIFACE